MRFDDFFQRYARLDKQGGVTVCRLNNGREEVVTRLPAHGQITTWGMSPDGRFVAFEHGPTNDMAGGVRVWKVDGPEPVILQPEPPGIHEWAWAFHPRSLQLAVGHADNSVSVYDLATGRRVQRLAVSRSPILPGLSPA